MTLNLPPVEMKALEALAKKETKSKTLLVREAITMLIASRSAA